MSYEEPLLRIVLSSKVPSWNAVLGLGHWQRRKLKRSIQANFESWLRATDDAFWMKTICVKNGTLTVCAMLELFQKTHQKQRTSKCVKRKLLLKAKKGRR